MTTYIHQVTNKSQQEIHVIVLSASLDKSYDVVLGPGEIVQYDKLLHVGGAPVPRAESAGDFEKNRIKLRIGTNWFAIYECQTKVRLVAGDTFNASAEAIPGEATYPTIELVIGSDGTVRADIYSIVRGDVLAAVGWTALGQVGLYGIGDEQNLVEKAFTTSWGPWTDLGKPPAGLAGPLTGVSWVAGRYAIYALGTDGTMYERAWLTNRWEGWIIHNPPPQASITGLASVSWIAGRYAVYAVTNMGDIQQKFWNTDHWEDWSNLGHPPDNVRLTGLVTAVCWSGSRFGIYALGNDGQIWQKWWATSWSDWESIGTPPGVTIKSLSSSSGVDRNYSVSAVGSDGKLWVRRYKYGWYDWELYGDPGVALDGPVADFANVSDPNYNFYNYFTRGKDGAIYCLYNGKWRQLDGR